MTRANFKRVDLDRVYLPLVSVALQLVARCEARGVSYVATYDPEVAERLKASCRAAWRESSPRRPAA